MTYTGKKRLVTNKFQSYLKHNNFWEYVKFWAISWKFDILLLFD